MKLTEKDKIEIQLKSVNRKISRYANKRYELHKQIKRTCLTVDGCVYHLQGYINELKEVVSKLEQLQDQKELLEYFLE